MALIGCPECDREVSTRASVCPDCGCPISSEPDIERKLVNTNRVKNAFNLVARLGIGFVVLVAASEGSVEAGVIGGLIIGGSVIPAALRMRVDALRQAGRMSRGRSKLEDRIADLEDRLIHDESRREDSRETRLAELEERLDFAERLLTKRATEPDTTGQL